MTQDPLVVEPLSYGGIEEVRRHPASRAEMALVATIDKARAQFVSLGESYKKACDRIEELQEAYRIESIAAHDAQVQRDHVAMKFAAFEALEKGLPCAWTYDADTCSWDTACGHKHIFSEDGPFENMHQYCPYCGARLMDMSEDEPAEKTE